RLFLDFVFSFSSRRRHTRFSRDWSSDVCSSDLNLTYWWVDGFVDLNDDQSVQLRKDIRQFFDWHAFSEMPQYADRLLQWQDLVRNDTSAEQACGQFQAMRQAYLRGIERSVEPLA